MRNSAGGFSMKLKTSVLLLAALLFSTPACAYQLLSIPPNGLYLIICSNGETYPWQTAGPNGPPHFWPSWAS